MGAAAMIVVAARIPATADRLRKRTHASWDRPGGSLQTIETLRVHRRALMNELFQP